MTMSTRTRQFLCCCAGILVLALCLRLPWMYNALEYDELWSLQSYASLPVWQILTDLGLPNNHPLNSLWLKIVSGADSRVILRLHSLLAGLGTVLAGGWFALYYFRSRRAALWSMVCLAVSVPLVGYSQAARGYSLQLFFITLFALSAVAMQPRFRAGGVRKYLPELGLVISGAGAIWSVTSSALFLFPVSLAALWFGFRRWKRGDKEYAGLAVFAVFGLLTLCWYGWLWRVMQGAQNWAAEVTGAGMYFSWCWKTFWELGFPPVLFVPLAVYRKNRVIALAVLSVLLLSIWTNLAGTRVYLPLVLAFALMTGYGASRFRRRGWILPAVFALCSLSQKPVWTAVDWFRLADEAGALPPECIVLYSATASYPMMENNGSKILLDLVSRLQYSGKEHTFVLVGSPRFNGTDAGGSEREIVSVAGTEMKLGGLDAWQVRLDRLKAVPGKGELVLAVIPPQKPETAIAVIRQLAGSGPGWQLNHWLTRSVSQNGRPFLYRLALFRVDRPEVFDKRLLQLPPQVLKLYHAGKMK